MKVRLCRGVRRDIPGPLGHVDVRAERSLHFRPESRVTFCNGWVVHWGLDDGYDALSNVERTPAISFDVAVSMSCFASLFFCTRMIYHRSFEESVRDEPLVYRLLEAVLHYGEVRKLVNYV